jgi:predicted amidohydrolase
MRVALAQTAFTPKAISQSFDEVEKWAAQASNAQADLVAFPELFICGYLDAISARALSLTVAELAGYLSTIARRHRIAICAGYSERDGEMLYNSAMLVDTAGNQCLNYRKMHLWGDLEKSLFSPGDPSAVVQIQPDCSVGILICYDLDIPAAMQDLQRRGADMAVVISATGRDYSVVPRMQVPARAYENSLAVAFCNHAGGKDRDFAGESAVAVPDGSFLAQGSAEEELVVADLKIGDWQDYRSAHRYVDDQRVDYFPMRPLPAAG